METILAWDSKSHGGTMPEGYLHLTCEQRCQICALLQSGHSQAHIARTIGVDPSTISRELVRNTGARGYRFKQAHEKALQRRKEASDKPRKMTPNLVALVEEKLTQEQWSPDQISGRLAQDGVACISHERIYQHVWKDKKDGGKLYLHLRHSGKKYNKRKGKNSGRGLIPNRVDIDQRPAVVAAKSRIGDWEADTIIGANHRGAVMSHVERKSKYTKLAKLADNSADSVLQACARAFAAGRPHRNNHLRQWKRVRLSRRDRNLAGIAILFCQTISLMGTWPQRTHQRPIQTVLPKRFQSLYCV